MTSFDQDLTANPAPKYDHYEFPTIAPTNQTGHSGHTTPEQDAKVHQLRTMLEGKGYSNRLDTLTLVGYASKEHDD